MTAADYISLTQGDLAHAPPLSTLLGEALAVRYVGVLDAARCASLVEGIVAAEAEWTSNFDDAQFTLGRAWYTHLEEDDVEGYFAGAAASRALVDRHAPGLVQHLFELLERLLGAPVEQRQGWCGPGVHVFPARGECASLGGAIHYDEEGLLEHQLEARVPALSVVLMLQTAEQGGALRLWDCEYHGEDTASPEEQRRPSVDVPYGVGDLVVFSSYRLHQIQPFSGDRHRVSATVHLAYEGGAWQAWF